MQIAGNFFIFTFEDESIGILAENLGLEWQLKWQGQLSDTVTAIIWSPTARNWVACSATGEIRCCQLAPVGEDAPPELHLLQRETDRSIDRLGFSHDGCWLAAGGQSGEVLLWAIETPHLPPQPTNSIDSDRWIGQLAWHPTLPQLAIATGRQVQLWDATTASEITRWSFAKSSVFDIAWHPSGEYIAIAGYKGVEIWATQPDGQIQHRVDVDTASICLAWSPDGRYLAIANLDRSLTILDWHHPVDPWILQGCPGKIRQLVWLGSTHQPCLAVASGSVVVLWHLTPDGWMGQLLEGHQGIVAAIAVGPEGDRFISAATNGEACLWSIDGEIEQLITTNAGFSVLAWQPQGDYLATGDLSGTVQLWSRSA